MSEADRLATETPAEPPAANEHHRPVRPRRGTSDERAISDVLGYIIIFSLIIVSIFIVVTAFGALSDVRDVERATNAERAFDVAAENMAAIYERNAPSRSTEIALGQSEIFYASNVSMAVSADGTELASYQVRPVEMRVTDDESLVYEGGAVFRDQGDAAVMLRDPPYLISAGRVHLPLVQTTAPALESVGSTSVLLRGESTRRAVVASDLDGSYDELSIEISSPRYVAWERHLANQPSTTCDTQPESQTVDCTIDDPGQVYVTHQQISLSFVL